MHMAAIKSGSDEVGSRHNKVNQSAFYSAPFAHIENRSKLELTLDTQHMNAHNTEQELR